MRMLVNYSIVTNIDYEHIDFYKNYKNLENSFVEFINKTPPTGKAIIYMIFKYKKISKKKNKIIFIIWRKLES